ncbi:MAG: MerR family transcriptional regulator [Alphaproteobacteria bacterium]|nr:MAG: MerR family transcriptional regulator [Alphaproteobacteria bacterium]
MSRKPTGQARFFTRGMIAARTGVNIETVRYYERIGLLPAPPRSRGGHRIYDEALLRRLNFIRRCSELGFTLAEIRSFLHLVDGGDYTCGEVADLTRAHLADVRRRIADLRRLEKVLGEMVARCAGGEIPDCPIIEALFEERR